MMWLGARNYTQWVQMKRLRTHDALPQCRLYLHWGPGQWAPPAERVPSLESIYRVSLTVDLCEG